MDEVSPSKIFGSAIGCTRIRRQNRSSVQCQHLAFHGLAVKLLLNSCAIWSSTLTYMLQKKKKLLQEVLVCINIRDCWSMYAAKNEIFAVETPKIWPSMGRLKWTFCWHLINSLALNIIAVDHLVNTASLGHTFYFEEVSDTSVFPHLMVLNSQILAGKGSGFCCLNYSSEVIFIEIFELLKWSGHKLLGKCLSDICCPSLFAWEQWENRSECLGGELATSSKDEFVFCE